jgi:transposase
MQITTIGLDIAKNVFQVHGIDAAEKVIVRKQLRRGQIIAFFDNDAAEAEAICEAVRRPTVRFVRKGQLMLHRARDLLMRQRTQLINALRAHLAEFGITAAQGREGIKELLAIVAQDEGSRLPIDAHASLAVLASQLQAVQTMIGSIEKRIVAQHRSNEASKRLETIPGIGVVGATTITALVTDPKAFRSGRDFAAWIGIVPRQDSTGGKTLQFEPQAERFNARVARPVEPAVPFPVGLTPC